MSFIGSGIEGIFLFLTLCKEDLNRNQEQARVEHLPLFLHVVAGHFLPHTKVDF